MEDELRAAGLNMPLCEGGYTRADGFVGDGAATAGVWMESRRADPPSAAARRQSAAVAGEGTFLLQRFAVAFDGVQLLLHMDERGEALQEAFAVSGGTLRRAAPEHYAQEDVAAALSALRALSEEPPSRYDLDVRFGWPEIKRRLLALGAPLLTTWAGVAGEMAALFRASDKLHKLSDDEIAYLMKAHNPKHQARGHQAQQGAARGAGAAAAAPLRRARASLRRSLSLLPPPSTPGGQRGAGGGQRRTQDA